MSLLDRRARIRRFWLDGLGWRFAPRLCIEGLEWCLERETYFPETWS